MTKAILFDCDGVLINAAGWHQEAFTLALADFGITVDEEVHEHVLNGLPTWKKLDILNIREDQRDLIELAKAEYFDQIIRERCKPDKAKIALLKALKGYKIAVCSNARTLSVYRMLERAQLLKHVDRVFGSDDVEYPKPHPDIYLLAMEELGVSALESVIVEDSRPGVEAAKASMAKVVVTPDYQSVSRELLKDYV